MSERLTDEQLRAVARQFTEQSIEAAAVNEAIALRERVATLQRLDKEAAEYVEVVICMRTAFTGDEPYVGWKGLGLALNEALDERDALRARVAKLEAALKEVREYIAEDVGSGSMVRQIDAALKDAP